MAARDGFALTALPDDVLASVVRACEAASLPALAATCSLLAAKAARRLRSLSKLREPPFNLKAAGLVGAARLEVLEIVAVDNSPPTEIARLVEAVEHGALSTLTKIALWDTKIGAAGTIAFAGALQPTPDSPPGGHLARLQVCARPRAASERV